MLKGNDEFFVKSSVDSFIQPMISTSSPLAARQNITCPHQTIRFRWSPYHLWNRRYRLIPYFQIQRQCLNRSPPLFQRQGSSYLR